MADAYLRMLDAARADEDGAVESLLRPVGFADPARARQRLASLCVGDESRASLAKCLPMLLAALADAALPEASLTSFERLVHGAGDRERFFRHLAENPRAVEILIRLFVGSQFLTEILLRNPGRLAQLTNQRRLAEFKSREQFYEEAREGASRGADAAERLDALRRYQQGELLRVGACDAFGLLDLRSVTVQLSLLADSLIQGCLALLSEELRFSPEGFAVLALGKLGGEELNYSSDIDLVFLSAGESTRYLPLAQRLVKALMEPTAEGFLYRVDMRLRPWGRSGALVNSVDAHLGYLREHGHAWERQALLKARHVAGDPATATEFLRKAEPLMFGTPIETLRREVGEMKRRIEADLERQGRTWGEVKAGRGSIRDVEFVTQFLQLAHGATHREVKSINTLDGLVRLADFGFLQADEYRHLTGGYGFLRTVEHALQLMHHKQTHTLPADPRELAYLARRLDFSTAEQFVHHYEQHRLAIRAIYDRHIGGRSPRAGADPPVDTTSRGSAPSYCETFDAETSRRQANLLQRIGKETSVVVDARPVGDGLWELTVVGCDYPGDLSVICGLLFAGGFDIVRGEAFSHGYLPAADAPCGEDRRFVDVFLVRPPAGADVAAVWKRYEDDLRRLFQKIVSGESREAQGQLAKRVAAAVRGAPGAASALFPVEIEIDNESDPRATVLEIRSEDTRGFLYELANALALTGMDIGRVVVRSVGTAVSDVLHVTDARGAKITGPARLKEIRAAVVLIKHFTHLLPHSPNPESALLHFRELLEQLFRRPNWPDELASLERPEVLDALARLLGVSDFLWEDFLRLQHENLFPVVRDVEGLAQRKPPGSLAAELAGETAAALDARAKRERLNAFKDREMFRTDMRHILGRIEGFGEFSSELTDIAEVVVAEACRICDGELRSQYGTPRADGGTVCRLCVCALGKFGGRELGFASDIELMFVYDCDGSTDGPEPVSAGQYYTRLVESFSRTIEARHDGVFEVDLRLRPYGRAGSLAVSLDAFRGYFAPGGPAWPYERQALVKLRPAAGDEGFGRELVRLRDELLYTGAPFDVVAMRAMRERQVRQLVRAGTFNAKLSPGGLVDCEYLIQGLQITHGHRDPSLRATNTPAAMAALEAAGVLSAESHARLSSAYTFLRLLIDALRMVRGHARDLTIPSADSEEFDLLAQRIRTVRDAAHFQERIARSTQDVLDLTRLLDPPG